MHELDKVVVVDPDACAGRAFPRASHVVVRKPAELRRAVVKHREGVWLGLHATGLVAMLSEALAGPAGGRTLSRLVLLEPPSASDRETLHAVFRSALMPDAVVRLLPREELIDTLSAADRRERFLGGWASAQARSLFLFRGDMSPLVVPFSTFRPSPTGVRPDFGDFAVIDFGHALKLGPYEAAADAVLYECDADYRRALARRRRAEDRSFGASVRRLRIQKGLRREAFAPAVSAKEIARIERNEVRPRGATLAAVARRLRVPAGELGGY